MVDRKTLEQVAGWLTDKPVFVRRIVPARAGAVGMACKNTSGAFFVDLHPELTGAQLIDTFLHEIAHIRLGHVITPSAEAHAAPASVPLYQGVHRYNLAAYQERERQADELAGEWLAWLRAHGGDLGSLEFWPVDVAAMIDQAARRAVDAYLNRR